MLAALLVGFKDALMTGKAGTSRPTNLQAAGMWIDTTNQGTPNFYWSFKIYTGAADQEVFRLSLVNGFGGTLFGDSEFDIKRVSADTTGPILQLIKNRIDTNGQVLNNDTVAELRFIGCTNTGLAETAAYLRFTATDDETTANYGGTLSFASTPDATSTVTEHFRFIGAVVEMVKTHKINSLRLVAQSIATAASIAALDASKMVAEMTGTTLTDIQGIDATKASQVIHIHNRASVNLTLKHEHASATSTNRMKLPSSADITVIPDATAVLYYCTTDARWKIISVSEPKPVRTIEGPFWGITNTWTAPAGKTKIRVSGRYRVGPIDVNSSNGFNDSTVLMRDYYGNLYAWGNNQTFNLGVGSDGLPRSSPVAVIGAVIGVNIKSWPSPIQGGTLQNGQGFQTCVLSDKGDAYCWGGNSGGDVGDGTVNILRSVPVAVIGKFKFSAILNGPNGITQALTPHNRLYSWGNAGLQFLANGNALCSSPVAVVGGLKFATFQQVGAGSGTVGLTTTGQAYCWGNNNGAFGNGSSTGSASSPIAVIGGLTFVQVVAGGSNDSVVALTAAGVAYAWGNNGIGQLGVGDVVNRSSPVAVLGGLTFKRLYTMGNGASFVGLTTAGAAYAWGNNSNPARTLGVGDAIDHSSPVAVLGGLTFIELFPNNSGCFGMTADGSLYAWGVGANGVLGIGGAPTVVASSPIAVLGGLKFEYFTVSASSAHGITADGTVYSWGKNSVGQLGVGDLTNRASPVAVVGPALAGPRKFGPIEIDVTGGTTYPIVLNMGNCFFGNTELDQDLDQLYIEYN